MRWRAVEQYNTLVFAVTQESYILNVHKSDFTQVNEDTYVLIGDTSRNGTHRTPRRIQLT
jgi:hypothetical protein